MNKNDIIKKDFSHSFWGYDIIEVDLFLDEVIRELERLHNELDIMALSAEAARQREAQLRERLARLTAERTAEPEPEPEPEQEIEPDQEIEPEQEVEPEPAYGDGE